MTAMLSSLAKLGCKQKKNRPPQTALLARSRWTVEKVQHHIFSDDRRFGMAKNLKEDDAQKIKEIIDGWSLTKKLSWKDLIKAIEQRMLQKSWTRQALSKHSDIYGAYKIKREAQKDQKGYSYISKVEREASPELRIALQTIARLESEKNRLQQENNCYKEMFILWASNAHSYGVTEEMLNRPLQAIDRGASKKITI
jgi:hypothetical protein